MDILCVAIPEALILVHSLYSYFFLQLKLIGYALRGSNVKKVYHFNLFSFMCFALKLIVC
jgi:hypothetical protein